MEKLNLDSMIYDIEKGKWLIVQIFNIFDRENSRNSGNEIRTRGEPLRFSLKK